MSKTRVRFPFTTPNSYESIRDKNSNEDGWTTMMPPKKAGNPSNELLAYNLLYHTNGRTRLSTLPSDSSRLANVSPADSGRCGKGRLIILRCGSSWSARKVHTLEVVGSSPTTATKTHGRKGPPKFNYGRFSSLKHPYPAKSRTTRGVSRLRYT